MKHILRASFIMANTAREWTGARAMRGWVGIDDAKSRVEFGRG